VGPSFAHEANEQQVKITDASVDSRPLDVTLLLDVSESTALPWIKAHAGLVAAAGGVQRPLRPDDTFTMSRFSEKLEWVSPDASPAVPTCCHRHIDAGTGVLGSGFFSRL
jgi:hypothetical protein